MPKILRSFGDKLPPFHSSTLDNHRQQSLMDYIIGQRWVSHADAQLGLGIVVDLDGRRVTLAFPAVGEERTYAIENAPLTRLRFKAGDHISTVGNVEVLVTGVNEYQGLLVYATAAAERAFRQTQRICSARSHA
jgi:hypothetical protein